MRFLFALRWKIGDLLKLDEPGAGTGSRVPSLRDRVPADLRDGPAGPGSDTLPFTTLYLTGDEWAAEIANQTMHGVLHLGWVPDGDGRLPRADGRAGEAERPAGHRVHGGDRPVPAPGGLPADAARHREAVARGGRRVSLPPGQRALGEFPRFGTHMAYPPPRVLPDHEIAVGGAVAEPFSVPLAALADLPRREQTADFHCVAGWSATGLRWEGVPFARFYAEVIEPKLARARRSPT